MKKRNQLISKGLYLFWHYLMLASLGLFLIICLGDIIFIIFFDRTVSDDFFDGFVRFNSWAIPALLALFSVSSSLAVSGFMQNRMQVTGEKDDDKEAGRSDMND